MVGGLVLAVRSLVETDEREWFCRVETCPACIHVIPRKVIDISNSLALAVIAGTFPAWPQRADGRL